MGTAQGVKTRGGTTLYRLEHSLRTGDWATFLLLGWYLLYMYLLGLGWKLRFGLATSLGQPMGNKKMTKKKFKNKISQTVVCKYNKLKLGFGAQLNEGLFALACRSLAIDEINRPHGVNHKTWVYDNARFIHQYVEKNQYKIKKVGGAWQFIDGHKPESTKTDLEYRAPKTFVRNRPPANDRNKKNDSSEYLASKEFLMSFEWRKLRMEALKKHGGRCQCCGASPATGAVLNVDHIKPRRIHPHLALELDNLQVLCHECNHGKGNWDETDWRNNV